MTCVLASLVQFSGSPFFICIMSTRTSDMALAHWWCPALVWLHTFLYISFSFSTEDVAGMSCEIDVLFLRLSIYTESLDDLKRYTSLHVSESHLSYQRRVVGLVWGHLKLTSHQLWLWMFCLFQTWLSLNYHLMSLHFLHQNLPPLLSCCPACLRIILFALWQFLGWNLQLVMRLVKQ